MRAKEEMVRQAVQVDVGIRNEKLTRRVLNMTPKIYTVKKFAITYGDFNTPSLRGLIVPPL